MLREWSKTWCWDETTEPARSKIALFFVFVFGITRTGELYVLKGTCNCVNVFLFPRDQNSPRRAALRKTNRNGSTKKEAAKESRDQVRSHMEERGHGRRWKGSTTIN